MRTKNLIFGLAAALVALGVVSVVILLYSSPSQTVYAGSGIDGNGEPFGPDVAEGDTVDIDGESYVMGEDGWAYREDGEVRCASVLSGPLNDPDELSEQRQQREAEDLPDDVHVENDLQYGDGDVSEDARVVADCDRLRQQRLGWARSSAFPR